MFSKLAQTWRFLRYGPSQLAHAMARLADAEQRLVAQEVGLRACVDDLLQKAEVSDRGLAAARADVASVRHELASLHQAFSHELADTSQALASLKQDMVQQLDAVKRGLAAGANDLQRESGWTRDHLSALATALDAALLAAVPADGASPLTGTLPPSAAAAEESFYPALEDQFRGTPEDIQGRLQVYRPWVTGLPAGPLGDLGAGRGEWLQLLGIWGMAARGVDLNALNAEQCRRDGLSVDEGDALQWLQAQPADSFAGLTAFHLVEHLPFGVLLRVAQEARRVLQPGGRLILETPNPENLGVATQTFWLDPTHVRPLPPALLELVVRHAGLEHETTLRLHPPPGDGAEIADATLRSLLMQGRDYAVVARKPLITSE